MIALDTNIISELMRDAPNPRVAAWVARQPAQEMCLPSIALAELLYGIAILPEGKRKRAKGRALAKLLPMCAGGILPLDEAAACCYAALAAKARSAGQTLGRGDAYIAATVQAHECTIATRDVLPFKAAGLEVVNPWN